MTADDRPDRELLEQRANLLGLAARWADDLAHEIKNPLHAMVINLELVKRRAAAGEAEAVIHRAGIVEAELHRVHDLIESLLRLDRPWPLTTTSDVDGIFEDLLPILGARTRVRRIAYEHSPGGGLVRLPPADLAQILLNLIDHAIEATPEGGRIATRCEPMREGVRIRVLHPAPARAGPGLAMAGRMVRAAGGSLTVEVAEGGVGTEASIALPRPDSA